VAFFKKKITVKELAYELDVHLDASKEMSLAFLEMNHESWKELIEGRETKIEEDIRFLCGFAITFAIVGAIKDDHESLEVIKAFGMESSQEPGMVSAFTLNMGKTRKYNQMVEEYVYHDKYERIFGRFLVKDIFGKEYTKDIRLASLMIDIFKRTFNTVRSRIKKYKVV
jgi:hypothetical protein